MCNNHCHSTPPLRLATLSLLIGFMLVIVSCGSSTHSPAATPTPTPVAFHALYAGGMLASSSSSTTPVLLALDPQSGKLIWRQTLNGRLSKFVAITQGVIAVSVALPNAVMRDEIDAFDATTGAHRWRRDLGADTQGMVYPAGNAIILATSAISTSQANAPIGLTLTALNASDGTQIWQVNLKDQELLTESPMFYDGSLYVVSGLITDMIQSRTFTLTAFDMAHGATIWRQNLGVGTVTAHILGDGALYISQIPGIIPAAFTSSARYSSRSQPTTEVPGNITAYRLRDGAKLWQSPGFMRGLAEANGILFAVNAIQEQNGGAFTVIALNVSNGAKLWQSQQAWSGDILENKPGVFATATTAYAINLPERPSAIHALQGNTGTEVWKTQLDGRVETPVLGLSRLFLAVVAESQATPSNTIMALDANSGALLWTYPLPNGWALALT